MPFVPIWDERLIFRDTTQIDRFAVHSITSLRDERAVLITREAFFRRLRSVLQAIPIVAFHQPRLSVDRVYCPTLFINAKKSNSYIL